MTRIFLALFLLVGCAAFGASDQTSTTTQSTVTATGTSTLVLAANLNRNYLLVQNKGSADVILKLGSVQSGSEGIIIPASGNYEPIRVPIDSLYLKSSTSTQSVFIYEGVAR